MYDFYGKFVQNIHFSKFGMFFPTYLYGNFSPELFLRSQMHGRNEREFFIIAMTTIEILLFQLFLHYSLYSFIYCIIYFKILYLSILLITYSHLNYYISYYFLYYSVNYIASIHVLEDPDSL